MNWPRVKISQVADIVSGATPKTVVSRYWDGDIPWVTPADLSNLAGTYIKDTSRKITAAGLQSCSATILPANSVLFSSRAPIGHVAINKVPMATNQGFKSFVIDLEVLLPEYLYWWLKAHRNQLEAMGTGATFKEVSKSTVSRIEIPLPPLDEQKRIAAILDKADALRAKRRHAITLLDSLTQSIFLEMFGDPVSNPKGWEVSPLSETADFISGGTPSKSSPSYWTGLIPWVSPKDMKSVVIADAIDHISESAVQQSAVKLVPKDTILIVVRGMILAHSVPIAILSRPAAFNQDIKGVRFHSHVEPHYGLWNLISLRSHILKEVASAAHGTKRIDMDVISKLPVLRAPISMQKAFKDRCKHIIRNTELMHEAEKKSAENFENLQSALFSSGAIE